MHSTVFLMQTELRAAQIQIEQLSVERRKNDADSPRATNLTVK